MKNQITFFLPVLLLMMCFKVNAQDIHFSQFYAIPMNLNPALTGLIEDKISLGHRQQGNGGLSEKFLTSYVGFEKSVSLKNKDIFGYGVLVIGDKTAKSGIHSYNLSASGSYSKQLNNFIISSGVQFSYTQKRLSGTFTLPDDPDQVYTAQQALNGVYSPINQLNINAGILASLKLNDINSLYFGISSYYINQHKESFSNLKDLNLKPKTSFHAGLRLYTSDEQKFAIIPNIRTMIMNKATNILFGTNMEYYYSSNNSNFISLGGWYRYNNSYCISLGMGINQWNLGLSYDNFYKTSLNGIASMKAMEIHLQYRLSSSKIGLRPDITLRI